MHNFPILSVISPNFKKLISITCVEGLYVEYIEWKTLDSNTDSDTGNMSMM